MNKRIGFWVLVLAISVSLGIFLWSRQRMPAGDKGITANEMSEAARKLGRAAPSEQPVLTPIDAKRPVRLAIGGLGLSDGEANRRVSDLVLAELSGAPGLNLVERQSLEKVLREMSLSLSGLVRAKDAIRVGKLLKADWFLLGTGTKINGTNSLVIRLVDARTGVLRDAGVFSGVQSSAQLAAGIATFVRQSRADAATARPRVYLAIGTFRDLSVNNRQAAFPSQLRAYLTTAYQRTGVTLLEREAVGTLLQEVRLDLAGLTEDGGTNAAQPMQSAYWLVEGNYQSYETTKFEVEVELEVARMFGRLERSSFRGTPDESLFKQIKSAIDDEMVRHPTPLWPSRNSEAHVQMVTGKELANLGMGGASMVYFDVDQNPAMLRDTFEAIRAFQTVLLLEPTNREAKMYLAACLHKSGWQGVNEARNYYRELLEEGVPDRWVGQAEQSLNISFHYSSAQEKAGWFAACLRQNTNSAVAEYYRQNAELAANDVAIESGQKGPKAIELARKRLLEAIRSNKNCMEGKIGFTSRPEFGMHDFVEAFGDDKAAAARELVDFLPQMKTEFPDLAPYLVASVVTFQLDTNAAIVAEFRHVLDDCVEHPDRVLKVKNFWMDVRWSVYRWCFEITNYDLAIKFMEGERRAAAEGNTFDFNDQEKIKLAYAYMAAKQWLEALHVFEGFSNQTVRATGGGPWGQAFEPILTDKLTTYCREKLGVIVARDPREFDISTNLVCMHTPSVFTTDADGLWLAISGQLIHLTVELKTNLIVPLPVYADVPITCIALGEQKIWIGTGGTGLVEFDKTTRQCRQLTEADGLMMNDLSSLCLVGASLWIGYGGERRGGLGVLDLRTQKLKSFMPSLASLQDTAVETPPASMVQNILPDQAGDLWVLVAGEGLRRLHIAKSAWEAPASRGGGWTTSIVMDSQRLVESIGFGQVQNDIDIVTKTNGAWPTNPAAKLTLTLSSEELGKLQSTLKTNGGNQRIVRESSRSIQPKGALHIYDFREKQWHTLENPEALPHPATAMALDGNNLWVGGEGFISLIDLEQNKVLKWCHVKASSVDRIQISGGYVWTQFDWHLHRVALSGW